MTVQYLTKIANKIANTISPSQKKNSKDKVEIWGLVQISKILADDSPISDKNSEQKSPKSWKFGQNFVHFQPLCSENSYLYCKKPTF